MCIHERNKPAHRLTVALLLLAVVASGGVAGAPARRQRRLRSTGIILVRALQCLHTNGSSAKRVEGRKQIDPLNAAAGSGRGASSYQLLP
jgi:hypothetical protein